MKVLGCTGIVVLATLFCVSPAISTEPEASRSTARNVHLADLPPEIRSAVELAAPETASQTELLSAIDLLAPRRRFESDALAIVVDLRWYAEAPEGGPRGPIALLRRWPGDTALALYALDPAFDGTRAPPLPVESSPSPRVGAADSVEWHGNLPTEIGPQPYVWFVRSVGEDLPRLGVLVLPGNAGLGPEATSALADEARFVAERVEVRSEGWRDLPHIAPGQPIVVPRVKAVPGETNERSEPWHVVSANTFTIGLPPGIRAMRLDAGVHAPVNVPGGLLWLRGRFHDIEGMRVTVGDSARAGYVARVEASPKAWRKGKQTPLGVPGATQIAFRRFIRAAERTGARSVTAERWSEAGFDGDWLVFRLAFDKEGYEIGLPMLEGWQSPSLFWIALTWRRAGLPPAPTPIDFADRFGIRFESTPGLEGSDHVVIEGTLATPGLVLRLPGEVLPEPALYSDDGYPIRFRTGDGTLAGTLWFIESFEVAAFTASLSALTETDPGKRHRADRVLENEEGWRLFVTAEGDIYGFQPGSPASDLWKEIVGSVRLVDNTKSDNE